MLDESGMTSGQEAAPTLARNVIFMVPDGFGDVAAAAYRAFKGGEDAPVWEDGLQASVQTHSASSPVTDSAAAATAYATGVKTNNGAIGVDVDGNRLVSVLELANNAGKATGIVTTDAVTGATPAAFAAHNVDRDNHLEIAQEYIDNDYLDVVLGGGRERFIADADGDGATTLEEAQTAGFDYVSSLEELNASEGERLLGLFGFGPLGLPIGDGEEPTLAQMTDAALARLSQDEDGFFLVVEEARTDIWGHANDAPAVMRSAESYEDAVRIARQYAEANPDTLVISVADHETGGMSLDIGAADTPAVFRGYQATYAGMLVAVLQELADLGFGADLDEVIGTVQATVSELTAGAVSLTPDEIDSIIDTSSVEDAYLAFSALLNARGGIDFATTSHTAANVSLHAFGAGADLQAGVIDNTAVAFWLAEAMGLSLPEAQRGGATDVAPGTAGDDRFVGTAENDAIGGGAGDDRLIGRAGDDRLSGNDGHDRLRGRPGDDVLLGADGDDRLRGGRGDDLLEGGDGSDLFVFGRSLWSDRIADFTVGEDALLFRKGMLSDLDAFFAASRETSGGQVVTLDDGNEIRIDGMEADAFQQADVFFV